MIWLKTIVCAAAVSAMATPALAQSNWNKPTEPFHIAGNIYYVGTEGLGAYLFTGPKGHVLLDGATPQGAPIIEANIAKLGFKLSERRFHGGDRPRFRHAGERSLCPGTQTA